MNDRELAVALWTVGFFAFALLKWPHVRLAMRGVVVAALAPKLVLLVLGVAAYLGALLYAGSFVGIWRAALVSDTALWFVATGLALYAGAFASPGAKHAPKRVVAGAIGLAVFMEVVVNFYVFALPVELLLVPFLTVLVAISVYAEGKEQYVLAKRLVDALLTTFGVVALAYVVLRVATDWGSFDWELASQKLALPVWLTLGALPLLAAGKLTRSRDLF
jgi:hypothetical protein